MIAKCPSPPSLLPEMAEKLHVRQEAVASILCVLASQAYNALALPPPIVERAAPQSCRATHAPAGLGRPFAGHAVHGGTTAQAHTRSPTLCRSLLRRWRRAHSRSLAPRANHLARRLASTFHGWFHGWPSPNSWNNLGPLPLVLLWQRLPFACSWQSLWRGLSLHSRQSPAWGSVSRCSPARCSVFNCVARWWQGQQHRQALQLIRLLFWGRWLWQFGKADAGLRQNCRLRGRVLQRAVLLTQFEGGDVR
mmetsp:Transcript_85185/g.198058  ORF Transcript_85185/g.198058 Transcript_85185/m.198058 type:complete len:250 (-) Transcript_85185:283-1032(-)